MLRKKGFFTPLVLLLALGTGAFMSVIMLKLSMVADDAVDMITQDKFITAINLLSDLRKGEVATNHQFNICKLTIDSLTGASASTTPPPCALPVLSFIHQIKSSITAPINSILYPNNSSLSVNNSEIILTSNSRLVFPEDETNITTPSPSSTDHLENYKSIILSTNSPKECRLFMSSFNDYHDISFISKSRNFAIGNLFPTTTTGSSPYPSTSTHSLRELCTPGNFKGFLWIKLEL
jgi:hypothetical protein